VSSCATPSALKAASAAAECPISEAGDAAKACGHSGAGEDILPLAADLPRMEDSAQHDATTGPQGIAETVATMDACGEGSAEVALGAATSQVLARADNDHRAQDSGIAGDVAAGSNPQVTVAAGLPLEESTLAEIGSPPLSGTSANDVQFPLRRERHAAAADHLPGEPDSLPERKSPAAEIHPLPDTTAVPAAMAETLPASEVRTVAAASPRELLLPATAADAVAADSQERHGPSIEARPQPEHTALVVAADSLPEGSASGLVDELASCHGVGVAAADAPPDVQAPAVGGDPQPGCNASTLMAGPMPEGEPLATTAEPPRPAAKPDRLGTEAVDGQLPVREATVGVADDRTLLVGADPRRGQVPVPAVDGAELPVQHATADALVEAPLHGDSESQALAVSADPAGHVPPPESSPDLAVGPAPAEAPSNCTTEDTKCNQLVADQQLLKLDEVLEDSW